MKLARLSSVPLVVLVTFVAMFSRANEDTKSNPYESIVARNPFQLKDPPPPVDTSVLDKTPPPPAATVEVTGVMNMLSKKMALLEIVPGPGKPAVKRTLQEGERDDTVEVLFIDVDEGLVKVKNGDVITNIALKVPKPAGGAIAGAPIGQPGFQPGVIQPGMGAGIIPPGGNPAAANPNASQYGGGNVMVVGGTPAPATPTATSPSPIAKPNLGAYGAGATPAAGVQNYGGNAGGVNVSGGPDLRPIPSRPIRTQSALPDAASGDPVRQYLDMAIQKQQRESRGMPTPPLPPIPGIDPNQ